MATMLPHIMDLFRGAPINPQQTGGPNPNTNTAANGVVPPVEPNPNLGPGQNSNVPAAVITPKPAPLDPFAKLWDPLSKEELDVRNAGNIGIDFENVDAKKMMEAAQRVDFTQVLTPEMRAQLAGGGEDAVRATIEAMNIVTQASYGQSALAASKMIGAAVKQAEARVAERIPELVKAAIISGNLAKSNPVFNNPAVKPIVEGLKSQMMLKFPNSTDSELTKMAEDYFMAVSGSFTVDPSKSAASPTGKTQKQKNLSGGKDDDWDAFFTDTNGLNS